MIQIFELPPILQGNYDQQLQQLRDYLLRLVLTLNEEAEK